MIDFVIKSNETLVLPKVLVLHTAKLSVPEPLSHEVKIAIKELKCYKSLNPHLNLIELIEAGSGYCIWA